MATPPEPLSTMTILELTRLVSAQDDRWGRILTYAQSTRNPAAPAGIAFFKKTWRQAMTIYFENVAARYDSAAKAPARIVNWWLGAMSDVVYPAARKVGLPDSSFMFPDITIEPSRPPSPPTVATLGAEAPDRGESAGVGTKIAFAALALGGIGLAIYAHDVHKLERSLDRSIARH